MSVIEEPAVIEAERAAPSTARQRVAALALRARSGDLGALPVVLALIVIVSVFQAQNDRFLSPVNITNLCLQVAAVGTIAVGIYFVMIVGEIDLSVGSVSGVGGGLLAVLLVKNGIPAPLVVVVVLTAGVAIGLFHGTVVTRFGVPAFVATLAGLIGWQGVQLYLLGQSGTINLPQNAVTGLSSTFLPVGVGVLLSAAVVVIFLAAQLPELRSHRTVMSAGRPTWSGVAVRTGGIAVAMAAAVWTFAQDRGVPLSFVLFVTLVVITDVIVRRTRYGRHLLAVGGNREAARRVGIKVRRVELSAFMICSLLAAIGGILAASRLQSVGQSSGGGDVLLNAIAAVVIGGTSLFGGHGRAWSALLGILVIGSVSNGMDLLGLDSSVKFIITGGVLLIAVTVDALARRGRARTGRP